MCKTKSLGCRDRVCCTPGVPEPESRLQLLPTENQMKNKWKRNHVQTSWTPSVVARNITDQHAARREVCAHRKKTIYITANVCPPQPPPPSPPTIARADKMRFVPIPKEHFAPTHAVINNCPAAIVTHREMIAQNHLIETLNIVISAGKCAATVNFTRNIMAHLGQLGHTVQMLSL